MGRDSREPPQLPLTNSRINRLLRPLRTKAIALGSHLKSETAASLEQSRHPLTTFRASISNRRKYGATSKRRPLQQSALAVVTPAQTEFGPLSGFPNVGRHRNMTETLEQQSVMLHGLSLAELYPKVMAIRDAFRNVMDAAFGQQQGQQHRMLTLSETTARCWALEIELDVMERETNPDEDSTADEWYEYIPLHLRRWTLAVHAIQVVQSRLPFLPCLFESLLDICIEFVDYANTREIIRMLLQFAFTPTRSQSLLINLSVHDDYLARLQEKYTAQWPASDFIQDVLHNLQRSPRMVDVWLSPAIGVLFAAADLDGSTRMAIALARLCQRHGDESALVLLSSWSREILRKCCATESDRINEEDLADLVMALAMLQNPDAPQGCRVQAAFVSLTTFCLCLPPSTQTQELISHLSSIAPHPSVFNPLLKGSVKGSADNLTIFRTLQYQEALRNASLFQLEILLLQSCVRIGGEESEGANILMDVMANAQAELRDRENRHKQERVPPTTTSSRAIPSRSPTRTFRKRSSSLISSSSASSSIVYIPSPTTSDHSPARKRARLTVSPMQKAFPPPRGKAQEPWKRHPRPELPRFPFGNHAVNRADPLRLGTVVSSPLKGDDQDDQDDMDLFALLSSPLVGRH